MERHNFLARKKVGLILRVYAREEEQIPARIEMVENAIEAAYAARVDGKQLIQHIDVLIWENRKYVEADCGQTHSVFHDTFFTDSNRILPHNFHFSRIAHGDIFCGILNHGVAKQLRHGVDYSIIASAEAFSYMTPETMEAMVDAACSGALAIGVAINELTESILRGRIANTFAMWHNESLMTVGGFDLRAAKPVDDLSAVYMKGWNPKKGDVFYPLAGVEEVIPLARMVGNFGPCIAPILPRGDGIQKYQVPDPVATPELYVRYLSKMGTKIPRQDALLAQIGCDPSYLEGGVMPEYRNQQ